MIIAIFENFYFTR